MQLNNVDKNILGNVIIIFSTIIVLISMFFVVSTGTYGFDNVEWNGMYYLISDDCEYEVTDNSLVVTSPYKIHNLELKKTNDLTNYNENIVKDQFSTSVSEINGTHSLILNEIKAYGVIVPTDSFNNKTYEISGNPEIIEINGEDSSYITSFIFSATYGDMYGT